MTERDDVEAAVAEAAAVAPAWASTPVAERARLLAALRRTVVRRAGDVVDAVTADIGKPAADVVLAEVLHAAAHAGWLARHAPAALAPRRVSSRPAVHVSARLHYRPRGVAAVIAPWNYPFLLPFLPVSTALAAGCPVVLKPSEVAPRAGRLLAELVTASGFPAGLVQVVSGGPEAGVALAAAAVDVIAVTGSTGTGRAVAAAAAGRLVPVISELGGKDPLLVLDDADLRRAARAAVWGACFSAGQSCVAVERVYVEARVHDAFVAELVRAFDDVAVATGDRRDVGPLATVRQADVVLGQIDDAVARGARLLRGGGRVEAHGRVYVEPTLLVGVDHGMAVMREETFGPVVPVMAVPGEAAAVDAANDSAYALGASVWTADPRRGRQVAARLRAGAVAVNDVAVGFGVPGLPFGGSGASGYGRQGGLEGIRAYCTTQSVVTARWRLPREVQWFPRLLGPAGLIRAARWLHDR